MGIFRRILTRIRKIGLNKKFGRLPISSAFGINGDGKGCILQGVDRAFIGDNCCFGQGTEMIVLKNHFEQELSSKLLVGNHVRATARLRITCADRIEIDDDVLMGPEVFITDHNHGMNPDAMGGYSNQKINAKPVKICSGVWLGQRVCVMPGVTIGEHSIIAAGSIVTKDIPPYVMVAGIPAKIIKEYDFDMKSWKKIE